MPHPPTPAAIRVGQSPSTPLKKSNHGSQRKRLAREAAAAYPNLTPDEFAIAQQHALPLIVQDSSPDSLADLGPGVPLAGVLVAWIIYAALPALLMALVTRRGLILMIFGAVIVTNQGTLASRGRAFARGLLVWSPFLAGGILAAILLRPLGALPTTVVILTGILGLTTCSHLLKNRSLPDRLAGTWLVPK